MISAVNTQRQTHYPRVFATFLRFFLRYITTVTQNQQFRTITSSQFANKDGVCLIFASRLNLSGQHWPLIFK